MEFIGRIGWIWLVDFALLIAFVILQINAEKPKQRG